MGKSQGSWAAGDGEVQHLSPCRGEKCQGKQLQHELSLAPKNSGYQIQLFLNGTGSCPAQFLTQL